MALKVEFNNASENPFSGMANTLRVFQNGSKGNVSLTTVQECWKEARTNEQKALVFALFFSIGDVTNRAHNVFQGGKRDKGGYAERSTFRDVILPFMWGKVKASKRLDNNQFLNLVAEYTTMDNILATRVKTKKNKDTVLQVINMVEIFGVDVVAEYCANIYHNGSPFQKLCLSKYLVLPKVGKQAQTKQLQEVRKTLLTKFCDLTKLNYIENEKYTNFVDYRAWRKNFNANLESVLFSTGGIMDLDKEEFLKLVQAMPASARYRTRCKLLNKDGTVKKETYTGLANWFLEWEKFKETKQKEQRVIEEKVRQGTASEKEKIALKKVTKDAKVTVGAFNFIQEFHNIIVGKVDKIKIQPFLDSINLDYNVLMHVDDSGSMNSPWGNTLGFRARDLAAFIATICLSKNPDDDGRGLLGLFSATTRYITGSTGVVEKQNKLMRGVAREQHAPLIDPNLHFLENLENMRGILNYHSTGNGTNVASIFNSIHNWVKADDSAIDYLQNYPVWTFISDGNFNNLGNASASLGQLFTLMENKVGFKPYVIIIDVARTGNSQDITNFTGMDNVMFIPPSPANIEMFLTNFKDINTYDVYTPLQSMYESNRYNEVKNLFLTGKKRFVEVGLQKVAALR